MKAFVLALSFALLASCASLDTQTKKIEASCASASVAIKALAVANNAHKLTADQAASVTKAVAVVAPICNPGTPTPPTLDDVKRLAFLQAVAELESRAAGLGK